MAAYAELDRLEGEGLVVFRYLGENPNGSARSIAGRRNERGNVVGLMPHPEHAVGPGFRPDTPAGPRTGTDGLRVFTSVLPRCWRPDTVRRAVTAPAQPQGCGRAATGARRVRRTPDRCGLACGELD